MKGKLTCSDECGMIFNDDFIKKLTELDKLFFILSKKGINITSGPRCEKYNTIIRGAKNSTHMEGIAADIAFENDTDLYNLIVSSICFGIKRIFIYYNAKFIHIDEGTKEMGYLTPIIKVID